MKVVARGSEAGARGSEAGAIGSEVVTIGSEAVTIGSEVVTIGSEPIANVYESGKNRFLYFLICSWRHHQSTLESFTTPLLVTMGI